MGRELTQQFLVMLLQLCFNGLQVLIVIGQICQLIFCQALIPQAPLLEVW